MVTKQMAQAAYDRATERYDKWREDNQGVDINDSPEGLRLAEARDEALKKLQEFK